MFEDMISIEAELRKLKIEKEEVENDLADYKGMTNVLQKQRQELIYLLKEASFFMHEFENTMPEDDFEQCSIAANKKYEEWLKEEFELSTPEGTATIQH